MRSVPVGKGLMSALFIVGVLGCQSDAPPPSASSSDAAAIAQTSPNLAQDHLLKTQTDALQKAKAVQDTIDEAAQKRAQEMEDQAGN